MLGVREPRVKEPRQAKPKIGRRESLWLHGLDQKGEPRLSELRMPADVLAANLPASARRVNYSRFANWIGFILGAFVLAAFSFAGMLFGVPIVLVGFMAGTAAILGGAIGWFTGQLFRPAPYWKASYVREGDDPPLLLRAGWPISILGSCSKPRPLHDRLLSGLQDRHHPTESAHARYRAVDCKEPPLCHSADQPLSGVLLYGVNMIRKLVPSSRRQSRRRPLRGLRGLCETWPPVLLATAHSTRSAQLLSG